MWKASNPNCHGAAAAQVPLQVAYHIPEMDNGTTLNGVFFYLDQKVCFQHYTVVSNKW